MDKFALLIQLPVPSSPALNTPLAAGYLKAYAEATGAAEGWQIAILGRDLADYGSDAAILAAIAAAAPDLIALSLYTWNSERSLALAARAKAQLPQLRVLVGGPEVQLDNEWVLAHPAVDWACLGEGERTFAELLAALHEGSDPALVPGIVSRDTGQKPHLHAPRAPIDDLSVLPSPYLGGHVAVPADALLMVEISRWCPYACSFCLYGRNMGSRLGQRYFGLERVLAEIAWGRAQGIRQVHFVEANLNLVPIFQPLMRALAELNADRQLTFYAELRGEHLTDEAVALLAAANVCYAEVGLQTANPVALRASQRRTDLAKWAAGTRRLLAAGTEIALDVILGLPEDDADGVAATLQFLADEELGGYDIFTLQVLPGTAVRAEADGRAMRYQPLPPYYVLDNGKLTLAELRRLRAELRTAIGLDPQAVEGAPRPRSDAFVPRARQRHGLIDQIELASAAWRAKDGAWQPLGSPPPLEQLAAHLDLVVPAALLPLAAEWIGAISAASPTSLIDLYLDARTERPTPATLWAWRAALPWQPSYLDRIAVYADSSADEVAARVSPRLWLLCAWEDPTEPADYPAWAHLIWAVDLPSAEPLPLGAWRVAGGAGIALTSPATPAQQHEIAAWATSEGRIVWRLATCRNEDFAAEELLDRLAEMG